MKRLTVLKQKQIGILLIVLGSVFILFISIFLYFEVIRGSGFTELIAADSVAAYIEFPTNLDSELVQKINPLLQIDWNKNVLPWASDKAALVFLHKKEENPPKKLIPYLFIQMRSSEGAFTFLSRFRNPENEIHQTKTAGITAFHTPSLHFSFLGDVVVISPSTEGLDLLMSAQSSFVPHVSGVPNFKRIRKALRKPFFVYFEPQNIPPTFPAYLGIFLKEMPLQFYSFPAIGMAANKEGKEWEGETYIPFDASLVLMAEEPYQANLLNYIPEEFTLLLAGRSLPSQIKKIDHFIENDQTVASLGTFLDVIEKTSLKNIALDDALATLAGKEFALVINPSSMLFVSEIDEKTAPPLIEKLLNAIKKIGPSFTPAKRAFELADGGKAFELIPGEKEMEPFETKFQTITIKGLLLNEKSDGIFTALYKGKLFASNNLALLQKSLLLAIQGGRSFRESERYRKNLRGILKNPELLGIAGTPEGIFSFSKRTYADHMEANFMWRPQ